MKFLITISLLVFIQFPTFSQTNIKITKTEADQVIKGEYDPTQYASSNPTKDPNRIVCEINEIASADSIRSYLEKLQDFKTRHTYSDTLSIDTGIGAARRWVHAKFGKFSTRNENRLIASYLKFDKPSGVSCGPAYGLRNILAVLPGYDTSDHSNIIIEAHIDSRCEGECDINCFAPGVDDNGSGTALVIELARVMSSFSFKHTIVFMLTIGEEQGLIGAAAMSKYCLDNSIPLKGVLNNDVVGGIECGATSSPPSCPYEGHIDSLQLRIFSNGNPNFSHRGFARTIRMFYEEKLKDEVSVPVEISIMNQEDRTGRGGDHIPFRIDGFRNLRFTSANEHGDAGVGPGYTDRQHTSNDILGVDTGGDMIPDKYFVDFNYLTRNTVINGMSAALLASGPETPDLLLHDEAQGLRVEIIPDETYKEYRIGVRSQLTPNTYFDAVYRTTETSFRIPSLLAGQSYFISVAAIDSSNIMSPFSNELFGNNDSNTDSVVVDDFPYKAECGISAIDDPSQGISDANFSIQCFPNPTEKHVTIKITISGYHEGKVIIIDQAGREADCMFITLEKGENLFYNTHKLNSGVYLVTLVLEGMPVISDKLIITN